MGPLQTKKLFFPLFFSSFPFSILFFFFYSIEMIYLKFNLTTIFLFFFFLFSPSVIVGQTILQVTQTQTDGNVANLNVGGGFVLANNRGVNDFVNNGLLIGALTPSTNRNKFATQIDELLSGANLNNNNNNNQQLAILIDST